MTDLERLAARCEAADGGDRGLDAEIASACNVIPENYERAIVHGVEQPYWWKVPHDKWALDWTPFKYTTSLDAAMTLVPEGYRLQLSDWDHETLRAHGPWQAILTPHGRRCDFSRCMPLCDHAATPALALCAAALRARAMEANDGQ